MARPQKVSERKERVPLGSMRKKLSIPEGLIPPHKVGRWVNDTPGRLQIAQEGGYVFVDDPLAKVGDGSENQRDSLSTKVRRIVGKHEDGSPMMAYLMVIEKRFYDADQKAKNKELDEVDKAIKEGGIAGQVGTDGRYVPNTGINIRTEIK